MDQKQWQTIKNIVDTALDLDEEQQERFISEKCGQDESLKEQVFEFLDSIEKSETDLFLEKPIDLIQNLADDISAEKKESGSTLIGKTIDKYRIVDLIEHGGMGSVFIAERTDEAYQKKVALKLLRRGMDTPTNIARFKRERNILANLDHSNITRLLDGGVTKDGLPYLVMDFVDGIPIYEYCDKHQLGAKERLEIFKTVCKAVEHAHKNAVIHRDLKPSNILITDDGSVKVLDFGIAKLVEDDLSKPTIQTRAGARLLTLRYAAPEQVSVEPITTATDIYALGTLLYELLAGVHPFDFTDKNFREIEQIIQEESPEKPSVSFKNNPENQQKEIAGNRGTTPSNLSKLLADELNAIVLKSLRKEPAARYSSVEQLLDDLIRREKNMPLQAKDDTIRYKTSRLLRRRKTEIGVTTLLFIVITGFIVFHTNKVTQERNIAQQEARRADEVSSFLLELFDTETTTDTLSAAGLLQKGMDQLDDIKNEPAHANIIAVMGEAYMNFGEYEKAEQLLKKALEESKQVYGEESIEHAEALKRMGDLYEQQYEWEKAASIFRRSYELYTEILGEDHIQTGIILSSLSSSLRNTGQLQEAEKHARKAVEIHNQVLEPTDSQVYFSMAKLAYVLRERGELREAESIYLEIIEWAENNGSVNKKTLGTYYNNLGYLYTQREENSRAVRNYKNSLELYEQSYVDGHPEIINTRKNLASSLYYQDRTEEAGLYFKENLYAIRKKFGTNHWRTASALNVVGVFYLRSQQYANAESYLRESIQINRQVLGDEHLWTAYSEGLLTASLKFQGQEKEIADSLSHHHLNLYQESRAELDRNNRNHLNILIDVFNQHEESDSLVTAYRDLL